VILQLNMPRAKLEFSLEPKKQKHKVTMFMETVQLCFQGAPKAAGERHRESFPPAPRR
jgi:hypothetical protein